MMKKLQFVAWVAVFLSPATALAAAPTNAGMSTAASPAANIGDLVTTEFPTYDADKSGDLNASEFGTWMIAAKKQSGTAAPDEAWLSTAFAKADADDSKTVSASELTVFLSA